MVRQRRFNLKLLYNTKYKNNKINVRVFNFLKRFACYEQVKSVKFTTCSQKKQLYYAFNFENRLAWPNLCVLTHSGHIS